MRALASLAALALFGCASGPFALDPHLRWPIVTEPGRPRLEVAKPVDARPQAQRTSLRPGLGLDWSGVVREGTLRTGDADFAPPLLAALHADLVATLARGGSFASVAPASSRAAGPSAGAFVLHSELDVATATQWRSFRVTPFRIGFVRDRWGPPEARIAARYELHGASGRIWQGRVATRHQPVQGDLYVALAGAIALQHEELADRLDGVVRARAPHRVPTRVLDGCELGTDGVRRLLDAVNASFAREADLVFAGASEPWQPPRGDLDALLDAARAVPAPSGGVVLALAPEGQVREPVLRSARAGLSDPSGAHALALCDAGQPAPTTVAHELAHLFGAVHVADPTSIMSATFELPARFFEPQNRAALRARAATLR